MIRLEAGREFHKNKKKVKGETEGKEKEAKAGVPHCEITQRSEGPVFREVAALRRRGAVCT